MNNNMDPAYSGTAGTTATGNTMGSTTGSTMNPTTGNTMHSTPMNSTTASTSANSTGNTIPTNLQTNNPLKAGLAAVHGAGETLRGTFNSAVDGAFGDKAGMAKNQAVASGGIDEVETGRFTRGTKEREGVLPSDGGRRV